jgi:hypothetical protein
MASMSTAEKQIPWYFTPAVVIVAGCLVADDIFAKLSIAGARPIRETAFGFIWVVAGDEPGLAGRLASQGAIGAYRELPMNPTIAGCFALADAKIAEYTGP